MSTADIAACEPDELRAQVAVLLDRAALLAWQQAETAGAESPLHDLGLGIYLARGTATHLLTADCHVDEPEDIDERSVLELLIDAESLTGALIGTRADFTTSGLAVQLSDLIREAQAHG